MSFDEFFARATGGLRPFPYQRIIADRGEVPWLLDAPTGAGKTAAAVLGWLWRRRVHPDRAIRAATPRRLVYCLPMRVLVEQTVGNAREWLTNLDLLATAPGEPGRVGVYQLMGGQVEMDWDAWPEADAILVGTQDQLLLRGLNRGYSMSRYRWPVDFGLLNNDCLWVMDEVQLMGAGLPTTSQLHAFRNRFVTHGPVASLWMSATLSHDRIATVDAPSSDELTARTLSLTDDDRQDEQLAGRLQASKPLRKLDLALTSGTRRTYASKLAEEVAEAHETGSLTLVVMNQVKRAQELALALREDPPAEVVLLHSRFRAAERRRLQEKLEAELPEAGRVVVSTQAVEAGVDISARTLFTELAPWSSLVQRFGRCNRRGEWSAEEAAVHWIDLQTDEAPYDEAHLELARELLQDLDDAGISAVGGIEDPTPAEPTQVLRRRDLLELFDTTPDLAGNDIDVSPFIREVDDLDVSVLWRDIEEETAAAPAPEELCTVRLPTFDDFIDSLSTDVPPPQVWDGLEDQWVAVDRLRPGMTVLLDVAAGGYDPELGWWPDAECDVLPVALSVFDQPEVEGYDDDQLTMARRFVTLSEHA
ncbi:MAG: CRISPR-associated helicase Cas3', partial [Armatimonadota bacterium]